MKLCHLYQHKGSFRNSINNLHTKGYKQRPDLTVGLNYLDSTGVTHKCGIRIDGSSFKEGHLLVEESKAKVYRSTEKGIVRKLSITGDFPKSHLTPC